MTRGELRPFHITLITTCRVLQFQVSLHLEFPEASRRFLSRVLKPDSAVESMFLQSRGTWAAAVVRLSRPRSTRPRSRCKPASENFNTSSV